MSEEPSEDSPETGDTGSTDTEVEAATAGDEKPAEANTADDTPELEHASDNRNNSRVNLDRPVLIRVSSGETVKAHLVNLSCGGLAFEYPAAAETGAVLTMLFKLSDHDDVVYIQAEGIARHTHIKSESYVIGVEFTKISEKHVDIIEAFVELRHSTAAQLTGFAITHRHQS